MKKLFAGLLAVLLTAVLALPALPAQAADETAVQQTVQALGIIVGDESGSLDLSGSVTRAQFAKMMIAASSYKDAVSAASGSSPFKDVRYTHWAAAYVQTAVTAGWLTGYTDGTFRPDNTVTLEEAASAVLRMLGYTTSDFYGAYPTAQLSKFAALGLGESISKTQGQSLTRRDCMYLFYNLMGTKTTGGSYYGTTLGYSVNDAGEVDYSSLILENMKGPFVLEGTSLASALSFTPSSVYLNGASSTLSAAALYDVYYYNTDMRTVWVYRNQVSGVYTAASPSTAAPSSVTVGGQTYSITTASAAYALSSMGTFNVGDTVTLLLGMNGDIVAALSPDAVSYTAYGFVTGTGTDSYKDVLGTVHTVDTVTVSRLDGITSEYPYDADAFSAGDLVKISVSGDTVRISTLSARNLSGTVSAEGTKLGSYTFADDAQIVDASENGSFVRIYGARIAGLTLTSSDVRYFATDDSGKITTLILDDVTGDMYDYGILTGLNASQTSASATYSYILNGVSASASKSGSYYIAGEGPVLMEISGSTMQQIRSLTQVKFSALNTLYGTAGGEQYTLGDGVSVYLRAKDSDGDYTYTLSTVGAVSDTDSYTLYGWYNGSMDTGGRIRVIIATAK